MTARARIPETPVGGTPGVVGKRECGCVVAAATRARGRRVIERCAEGQRLWDELRARRDEMQADELRLPGWRVGHKARRDAFAQARDEYHRHVFGEVMS